MPIEIIQSIEYAPINEVISYNEVPDGKVIVNANWKDIPIHRASGELNSSSRNDAPGTSHSTTLFARLKQNIGDIPLSLIKVTLCSGRVVIIGTPFLPAKAEGSVDRYLSIFSVNHRSIKPPLELIQP